MAWQLPQAPLPASEPMTLLIQGASPSQTIICKVCH